MGFLQKARPFRFKDIFDACTAKNEPPSLIQKRVTVESDNVPRHIQFMRGSGVNVHGCNCRVQELGDYN